MNKRTAARRRRRAPQSSPHRQDVDGNGTVEINDATEIQLWVAQFDTPYPIGEPTQLPAQPTEPPTDADGWGREIFRL